MPEKIEIVIGLSVLAVFFLFVVLFLLQQQRLLRDIRPENRLMPPGNVWLQLIPFYGLFFQFKVVAQIADSIRNELTVSTDNNWLDDAQVAANERPTYNRGITLAVPSCCSLIRLPILENIIALAIIIWWILYWIELRKYHQQIKQGIVTI